MSSILRDDRPVNFPAAGLIQREFNWEGPAALPPRRTPKGQWSTTGVLPGPGEWVGRRFGRLTATGDPFRSTAVPAGKYRWRVPCRCDCGNRVECNPHNLVGGRRTISCGCVQAEKTAERSRKHGMSRSNGRIYRIWAAMRNRCRNARGRNYPKYGGRGIEICDQWDDYQVFHHWAMANGYRDDLSIDRIDNDGGYSPENCRWATAFQQAANRSNSNLVTAFGETKVLSEWARDPRCSASASLIGSRISLLGWEPEDAIIRPSRRARPAS